MAAINAATADLPSDLPTRPFYRKFNPAEAPIMTLALSSATLSPAKIYDAADTILAQRLSRADGVAQVTINGAEKPAIRVRLDPVRLAAAGPGRPGRLQRHPRHQRAGARWAAFRPPDTAETIGLNGQISQAEELAPLIVRTSGAGDGAPVGRRQRHQRQREYAARRMERHAIRRAADDHERGRAPTSSIPSTASRTLLPQLMTWLPPDIQVTIISDRTTTIRASVHDVRTTLLISIVLVLLVVLIFMRRLVATVAAAVTVPLSICGTLGRHVVLRLSRSTIFR